MYLIDTSVWIDIFRDSAQTKASKLKARTAQGELVLCRFTQLELLQGAKDQREWELLDAYLKDQHYLELWPAGWREAARLYFALRRSGRTVRSPIDCCIAQIAVDCGVVLLHRDRDFITIAERSKLEQEFVDWDAL